MQQRQQFVFARSLKSKYARLKGVVVDIAALNQFLNPLGSYILHGMQRAYILQWAGAF